MATIVPTVPGIGAALGTGLSKSLEAIAQGKIKQMIEAPQQEKLAQIFSYLSGAPAGMAPQGEMPPQATGQEGVGLAPQGVGQVAQPQQQLQAQPRQLDQQTFQKLLAQLPPHLQAQAVAAYQGQQAKIAEREKEERKNKQLNQREINKRTQPFYDKIIEGDRSAKQIKHRLGRLKELEKAGNLPPAALYNALTSLESIGIKEGSAVGAAISGARGAAAGLTAGGPIGALIGGGLGVAAGGGLGAAFGAVMKPITTILRAGLIGLYPDTEEYEKTSLEFIKEARPLIGGHVTEDQLSLFLKSIPTLATTAPGREKMINNIGVMAESSTAEFDAAKEVIEDNGGERPQDFEFRVAELAEKKKKEYAKRWKN